MDLRYISLGAGVQSSTLYLMACAGIADEYAALQCMQRQHDQCIRGCGGTP